MPSPAPTLSLDALRQLLEKQKLYEGLIHGRSAMRQDILESLVHRQHMAEIAKQLERLSNEAVGAIVEALPVEDARRLWECLPEARHNDVLWALSDALRTILAGEQEPGFAESQMSAFELSEGRLRQVAIVGRKDLAGLAPVWIDLVGATPPERRYVGHHFGVELDDPGDSIDLEVSSRFQIDDDGDIRLHSNFLSDRDRESRSVPVIFKIHQGVLFTLRNEELPVFRLQRRRARTIAGYVSDCFDLVIDLYGADVEYSADALEGIYQRLNDVGRRVLSENMSDEAAAAALSRIAEEENLDGRIRSNILDTQRALSFLMRSRLLSTAQHDDARQVLSNIESLNSHTAFLFDKINFLMDATIGFININQNKRVSQLTAFGAVIMPLNIVAGIGGMSEFTMMTAGVPWPAAYGALVLGMALTGWATFVVLRRIERRRRLAG